MNNTIQLYIDKEKEIKGYPITSPDRVIDENGISIYEHLDTKVTKEELNSLGKIEFSGQYDTLEALKLAKPNGAEGLYLVVADGFTYRWSGGEWVKGVQFQSTGIADKSIGFDKLKETYVKGRYDSTNLFNGNYYSNAYVNENTGELLPNVDHVVTEFIKVESNCDYYQHPTWRHFAYYDKNETFISGGFNTQLLHTPINCEYVRLTIPQEYINVFQLNKGNRPLPYENGQAKISYEQIKRQLSLATGVLIVSKENGDFKTITDAIAYAKTCINKVTILIMPGVYEESLNLNGNTNINLIGLDKNNTIIIDKSGNYYKAPMTVSGEGYFKGISFISTNEKSDGIKQESYAVHIDHEGEGRLEFEDCYFEATLNSSVGIGLHQNQNIIFNNCDCYRNSDGEIGGAIFIHNNVKNDVTNQRALFKNCYVRSENSNSIIIQDANIRPGGECGGNDMVITMINNNVYAKNDEGIVIDMSEVEGCISGSIQLHSASHGNNSRLLNYDTLPVKPSK